MSRIRRGFTLIEVALFLAITGALFIAVTVGVQNSISQQRYNDVTQNFVEFLRDVYAEAMNVQSADNGRSEQAIYGKLLTFGESYDLASEEIKDPANDKRNHIFLYDVIGDVEGDVGSGNSVLTTLNGLGVNPIIAQSNGDGDVAVAAGIAESYVPRWAAVIQPPCGETNCKLEPIKMAILVIRHPRSGTVYTYVLKDATVEVNKAISQINEAGRLGGNVKSLVSEKNPLRPFLIGSDGIKFERTDADFCLNPNGNEESTARTDVRILKDARNSSSIEILADFTRGQSEDGNRCIRK